MGQDLIWSVKLRFGYAKNVVWAPHKTGKDDYLVGSFFAGKITMF